MKILPLDSIRDSADRAASTIFLLSLVLWGGLSPSQSAPAQKNFGIALQTITTRVASSASARSMAELKLFVKLQVVGVRGRPLECDASRCHPSSKSGLPYSTEELLADRLIVLADIR